MHTLIQRECFMNSQGLCIKQLVFPDIETEQLIYTSKETYSEAQEQRHEASDSKTQEQNFEETHAEIKEYDAVIVGAGLAGLTTAVELSKAGKSILLIEYRDEKNSAIRPQLIWLTFHTVNNYLKDLYNPYKSEKNKEDEEFFKKLKMHKAAHYGIKDIQRFLKRQIDPRFCTFLYESTVLAVHIEEGSLVLAHVSHPLRQQKVKFKNLVLADGAKQHTSGLLKEYIQYQPVQDRPEKKHIMACFTAESKDKSFINLPYHKPTGLVVHRTYYGIIYVEEASLIKNNFTKMKICMTMHVPDELFQAFERDRESGIQYLKRCVASVFNEKDYAIYMTQSKKSGQQKDNLKYAAFRLNFEEANQAAFEINGNKVILVGERRRNSDFYQAHGGNDAIRDGRLASSLVMGKYPLKNYNTSLQERSKEVSEKTKKYQPIAPMPDDNVIFSLENAEPMIDSGSKLFSGRSLGLFTLDHSTLSDAPSLSARTNSIYRP